jgi:TfoX/Sxy family transcriptional regulator of competence genes
MAYDEDLADRVRTQLAGEEDVSEMRMFGGLAFLLAGNMAVAVSAHGGLMLRVGPEAAEDALCQPHTEPVVMRGRPMGGWIRVAPEGLGSARQLQAWVRRGVKFALTLPPKG